MKNPRNQAGFSLMELLIVVTIIGVLLGVFLTNADGVTDQANEVAAKKEIQNISLGLQAFYMHNRKYPDNAQGLEALIKNPGNVKRWKQGGYLEGKKEVPLDPWGREYKYRNPGQHGKVDVYSLGADGREGNDDVGNWND